MAITSSRGIQPAHMFYRLARSTMRASLLAVAITACASSNHGPFVWINDYAPAMVPVTGYVIGPGDVLSIEVYDQPKLSTKEQVRPDGKLSMPLLGEITVADKAPAALAQELERTMKERSLVLDPRVSVHVDAMKPLS